MRHPTLRQRHPGIHIGRIIVVIDEDVVALAKLESTRKETQRQGRWPNERDLVALTIQQLRRQFPAIFQRFGINQRLLIITGSGTSVIGYRLRHALRQRTIPRMGEKNFVLRNRKLPSPQFFIGKNLLNGHRSSLCSTEEKTIKTPWSRH